MDHGARADAAADARYVEEICGQFGVPFYLVALLETVRQYLVGDLVRVRILYPPDDLRQHLLAQ